MELFSQILENWKIKDNTHVSQTLQLQASACYHYRHHKKNQRKRPQESKNSKNWFTKTGSNFWEDNKLTVGGNLRTWRNGPSGNET